jgi:hypothetical protein
MRRKTRVAISISSVLALVALTLAAAPASGAKATGGTSRGVSAAQAHDDPLCVSSSSLCVDPYNVIGDSYVGHDEPSLEFKSGVRGSGNDMTYTITLPKDPKVQPTASGAGGGTWNFQLRPTFWFGMTLCDTASAPEYTSSCTPDSDANDLVGTNPAAANYIGKHPGNAYMELQFYGPGYVPQF